MQQTQAEQAITNGAKVILLVNLDSGSGAAIIAQARDAGVKVIDYDRLTIEGPGADIYVSFDAAVGRLMGETLEPIIDARKPTPRRLCSSTACRPTTTPPFSVRATSRLLLRTTKRAIGFGSTTRQCRSGTTSRHWLSTSRS